MPKRRTLKLSPEQRAELEHTLSHDPRAYLRERAAALLKIADGRSPHWVAKHGLLKRRKPRTVYTWLTEYETHRTLRPRPPCRTRFSPQRPGTKIPAGTSAQGTKASRG
jgi:hypothetical protein